jgi:hypothetical protein
VGIEPARCMWQGSYLPGRIQKIRIGDAVSKHIKVTSGVPQCASSGLSTEYFENSVGSEQTVRVVRQKLIAPQRW